MKSIALIISSFVALEHLVFLYLEMFLGISRIHCGNSCRIPHDFCLTISNGL